METLGLFITPLLLANVFHHFFVIPKNIFSVLKIPVDMRATFKGKRVFGENKTYRGFIVVPLLTAIFSYVYTYFVPIATVITPALLGLYIGLLYMLGELPNSFLKRQFNILPGKNTNNSIGAFFKYFDHVDSFLFVAIMLFFVEDLSPTFIITLLVIGVLMHVAINTLLKKRSYKACA